MPRILETHEEFHDRHGGNAIRMYTPGTDIGDAYGRRKATTKVIYPDGAVLDDHGHQRHEPPTDRQQLLPLLMRYKLEQFYRAREEFFEIKKHVIEQGSMARSSLNAVEPAMCEVERMRQLHQQAKQFEQEWLALHGEYVQLESQVRNHEREQMNKELEDVRRSRIDEVVNAAMELSLQGDMR